MIAYRPSTVRGVLAGVAALLALPVIVLAPARGDSVPRRDAGGRTVVVQDPRRIVSIGGAVTEILYALGLDDRIVAVDTTSLYPPRALADKPSVGYMRQLSSEGIVGLSPTLILAAEGAGPKETITVLENTGIPFVSVPDHFTADGIVERIRIVARAVDADARGDCLAAATQADLAALADERRQIARPLRVMFVLSLVNDRPMVAGTDTAADGIIRLAGGINAIDSYRGYKLINDEAILAARPDAVLVMQRPQQTLSAADVFERPVFSLTPAAQQQRFVSMEGHYLLGFGPRTARAARDLAAALYPGVVGGELPSEPSSGLDACR
jgi:iron complex transport system substrate-binding protein